MRSVPIGLERERRSVDASQARAVHAGQHGTRDASRAVERSERVVVTAARHELRGQSSRLDTADARLRALDPRRVLKRGYTITRDEQGQVVRAAAGIPVGSQLSTETARGTVRSRVEEP